MDEFDDLFDGEETEDDYFDDLQDFERQWRGTFNPDWNEPIPREEN